jgi:hypothetical protein
MADLWFSRELGGLTRRANMLYAAPPGEVWAVEDTELVFADDLDQESKELLSLFGAMVHRIGHALTRDNVPLPATLQTWATTPDVPMARLGKWAPGLISVDGTAHLALSRSFDTIRAFATTWSAQHLAILTPATQTTATLVHRDDLDVPPHGYDQHGW